jgi:ATP-binding cassette subfamily F protein 3
MVGTLPCSRGTITRHPQLTIGHFSQHSVEELSSLADAGTTTALAHLTQHFAAKGEVIEEQDARACLGSLGLQGPLAAQVPISALSGGQKVRLALALLVYKPPQLLLLDEVTTHVDAPTVEALAAALAKFEGAIVLITHDRWFSRVVVEGAKYRELRLEQAGEDGSDDGNEDSSADDEDSAKPPGKTYWVGNGQVKELRRGMAQYVEAVERKLAKREKE